MRSKLICVGIEYIMKNVGKPTCKKCFPLTHIICRAT